MDDFRIKEILAPHIDALTGANGHPQDCLYLDDATSALQQLRDEMGKEIRQLVVKAFKAGWEGGEGYYGDTNRKEAFDEQLEDFKQQHGL